ncbi:OsmC family protein [Actinomadura rayongensis]|uniref:OsmC family peroxiredoxin n=1 Tax=Actinomadura rayongensis TaxID=1429076 RepID=A0A6I4WAB7_9ACTN|nr:OsmC family protein [Actinomadura rayongensis]MXQ66588.1 OsmC family peroxiredoxin [Actinomadura rayongensis]
MARTHRYGMTVTWTGDTGTGTSGYRAYERAHEVSGEGKPVIAGSADPAFRGDPARWNPEELLVASLSQCHMLWYLGLCAAEGVVVTGYVDRPEGTMTEERDGSGRFQEVVLRPEVTLAPGADVERARALHERAHEMCFIASSVSFPVRHEPVFGNLGGGSSVSL